jgi:hypothetical protein
MSTIEKPSWEKLTGTYDLKLKNPHVLNTKKYSELMKAVALPTADFNKNFSVRCQTLFYKWLNNPHQPLPEAVYNLLSNWPLSGSKAARESSRSVAVWKLWDALFCVRPERRLTNWRISGEKVIDSEFEIWWKKQLDCQDS